MRILIGRVIANTVVAKIFNSRLIVILVCFVFVFVFEFVIDDQFPVLALIKFVDGQLVIDFILLVPFVFVGLDGGQFQGIVLNRVTDKLLVVVIFIVFVCLVCRGNGRF